MGQFIQFNQYIVISKVVLSSPIQKLTAHLSVKYRWFNPTRWLHFPSVSVAIEAYSSRVHGFISENMAHEIQMGGRKLETA
jgi:hypothetical protein